MRLFTDAHVFAPGLLVLLLTLGIANANREGLGEDVGKFGTIAILTTNDLLLVLVVVAGCQQMAKDEFRDVALFRLMERDGDAVAVILNNDSELLTNVLGRDINTLDRSTT